MTYYLIESIEYVDVCGIHKICNDPRTIFSKIATDKTLHDKFEQVSKNGVPAIFEITTATDSNLIDAASNQDNLELKDPYQFCIQHKLSHDIYVLHSYNENYIINKVKKVAQKLALEHKDLSDYLNVAMKIATNGACGNITISADYIMANITDDTVKTDFSKRYNKFLAEAKEAGLSDIKRVAALAAAKELDITVD